MERHAYLIMAHGNLAQLSKLVSALDDERNDIYIHIDKKTKNFNEKMITATYSKVKFIEQINVNWGGYSIVKCELLLLEAAVKFNTDYVRYHLVSGADLPIKSQDYIHDFFEDNNGEYIRFDPKPISLYEDRVKYYYLSLIVKVVVSKNIYFLFFQVIRYCSVPDVSINKLSTVIGNHVRHRIRPDYHHFE